MPERKHLRCRRIDSEEVQGDGSWVKIKSPSMDDIKNAGEIPEELTAQMEYSQKLMSQLIIDWNWVDDEGNPLPKPSPAVLADLPFEEVTFLLNAINIEDITDQKK